MQLELESAQGWNHTQKEKCASIELNTVQTLVKAKL